MENLYLTRRQALKAALAAAGGLTAAAFLPARWTRPLVKTGVLPVHAQSSTSLFLSSPAPSYQLPNIGTLDVYISRSPSGYTTLAREPKKPPCNYDPSLVGIVVTLAVSPAGAVTGAPALPTQLTTDSLPLGPCPVYGCQFPISGYTPVLNSFEWVITAPGCPELRLPGSNGFCGPEHAAERDAAMNKLCDQSR
jgi:hypothetical protein